MQIEKLNDFCLIKAWYVGLCTLYAYEFAYSTHVWLSTKLGCSYYSHIYAKESSFLFPLEHALLLSRNRV